MFWNAILLAMREIRRNVLRSILTILGIVIGVAAVIIMVTIGNGATRQVTDQIASLGSNLIMVTPGQRMSMGQRSTAPLFKVDDATHLQQSVNGLAAVAPIGRQSTTVIAGNNNWTTNITGALNSYFVAANWKIGEGRPFTDTELHAGSAVCLLGTTVRRELFAAQNPIGSKIRLKKMSCEVIGLLQSKGQSAMGTDQDDIVVMPLRTFQRRVAGSNDVHVILVSVKEGYSTEKAQESLKEALRVQRHISANRDDDFSVMDMKEIANMMTGTSQVLTMLLSAVAAVSLVVGGIGIMNIMLVSVTERTREIGIRLAIGALEREVMMQFLVEAVVLSSLGGIVGILIALVASLAIVQSMQVPFLFSPGIVSIAFLFSALVGIVFGYFPARKAASLKPIDALRHE